MCDDSFSPSGLSNVKSKIHNYFSLTSLGAKSEWSSIICIKQCNRIHTIYFQAAQEQASKSVQLLPATNSTTTGSGKERVCCGVCGGPFEEVTDDVEDWIACDGCETWFHWICAGITEEPESFFCTTCKN